MISQGWQALGSRPAIQLTLSGADIPITTVEQGLLHLEFRKYPVVALREALVNAFVHADHRVHGVIQVRLYENRLEIANPGGFVGGVTERNILRHAPIARNPTLMNAMISLSLANRSNLGVPRMYRAMLQDGKEPPVIRNEGDAVRVVFMDGDFSVPFRAFVESAMRDGFMMGLEHLLVLNYLVRHGEIDVETAARICQQDEREARESLRHLVVRKILDARRRGSTPIWQFAPSTMKALQSTDEARVVPLTKYEAGEREVLAILEKAHTDGRSVSAQKLREALGYTPEDMKYLLRKLSGRNIIKSTGKGPTAGWVLIGGE